MKRCTRPWNFVLSLPSEAPQARRQSSHPNTTPMTPLTLWRAGNAAIGDVVATLESGVSHMRKPLDREYRDLALPMNAC